MDPGLIRYLESARLTFDRGWRHAVAGYCPRHLHGAFEIVFHAAGRGTTTDERGASIAFREGGTVIHPPGVAHDQRMDSPGEDICIHAGADGPPPPGLAASFYAPPGRDREIRREVLALAAMPPEMPPLRKLACDHRVAALFLRLVEASGLLDRSIGRTAADRYAEAAREYIREHFREIREISEVAERVGIGYDHLRHVFRRRYGVSVKRWHLEVRTERAKDLLAHSNLPLKAVADLCGFRNERYFSTCFRAATGRSPGAFRAR